MKHKFIYFISIILLLVACKQGPENTCLIEGKITDLTNRKLYVITENQNQNDLKVDTVMCRNNGRFSFRTQTDSISSVIIYFEGGKFSTTVWIQNQGKSTLSGSINYPELILVKGGEVNELLSDFRIKNQNILKERRDLIERKNTIGAEDSLSSEVINKSLYDSKIVNLNYTLKEKTEEFIKKHSESPASLILFQEFIVTWGEPEDAKCYFDYMKGEVTETFSYKKLSDKLNEAIERIHKSKVGAEAPDFSVVTLDNKGTVSLDSFKNKYLLLTFSASWCKFCEGNYIELKELRKKVHNNKLDILTISLDEDKSAWEKLEKKEEMDWYHSVDTTGWQSSMAYLYNINAIPANILIDKNKVIVGRNLPTDSLIQIIESERSLSQK